MEAPDFWDDAEVSQKKMKELKDMKDDMETYQNLVTQMEDMETMIEMGYEDEDPAMVKELEEEMLEKINRTGIGPGGLGGTTTALAVNINTYATHIAGLPVAVNICCHVNRHAVREI